MDLVDFDVRFERSALEALLATLRLVVFGWAMGRFPHFGGRGRDSSTDGRGRTIAG